MKVSEALERVWAWKQAVYEDIRELNASQRRAYFRQAKECLEAKTGTKLDLPSAGRRPGRRK